MKRKNFIHTVLYPLIVGLASVGIGIGLLFYYSYQTNATNISFIFSGIILIAGMLCVVVSIFKAGRLIRQNTTLKKGRVLTAEYVSHDCKVYNKNGSIYYITFKYNDGTEKIGKSLNEFEWKEVLALKTAKNFTIMEYKGSFVLMSDLKQLEREYFEDIKKLQGVYNQAYRSVDQIIEEDKKMRPQRIKTTYSKKMEKKQQEEYQKPVSKDD